MAKKNSNWYWLIGGMVIAYVLHGQIQGLVGQLKGAVGANYAGVPRAPSAYRIRRF